MANSPKYSNEMELKLAKLSLGAKPKKSNTVKMAMQPKNKKRKQKAKNLTPYQGENRCFGYFKCSKCKREWESGYSWANAGQECMKCNLNIYPYKQRKLDKQENGEDSTKPHQEKRCEKCKELGFCCKELSSVFF